MTVEFLLVSCLEKVLANKAPLPMAFKPQGLIGEEAAFQAAWRCYGENSVAHRVQIEIDSEIARFIHVYKVSSVPVMLATFENSDNNYLGKEAGLYPDLLEDATNRNLRAFSSHWESAYISINPEDDLPGGDYPITVRLLLEDGSELAVQKTVYHRVNARLAPQKLIHTRWFHTDGLCSYYNVQMFSERFWDICEKFIQGARSIGVNCILTPIHTPPLDTRVGGERLTSQLVDIKKSSGDYEFGFEKLERFVGLALKNGIEYFEMAHLFSQWGAAHAPKIMAEVDGEQKRIFGWETDATSPEYADFLNKYLAALKTELKKLGIFEKSIFHISDEPGREQIPAYLSAQEGIKEALKDLYVLDALSDIDLYESGAVAHPVPASNHIRPFLAKQIPDLWVYYCCGQCKDVSNAFITMPSQRTRIIGAQMYKFNIKGFLQWGYNFYNSMMSDYPINPFVTTDGDGSVPAGDCFIVYPGRDGAPLMSLRGKAVLQAMQDMRALDTLESLTSRENVLKILEQGIPPIEFDSYPTDADWLIQMRLRIDKAIEAAL